MSSFPSKMKVQQVFFTGVVVVIFPVVVNGQVPGTPTATAAWYQNSPEDEFEYCQGDSSMVYNFANVTNTCEEMIEARVKTTIYKIVDPQLEMIEEVFEFEGMHVEIAPDSTEEVSNAYGFEWSQSGDYWVVSRVVIQFLIEGEPVGGTNHAGDAFEADGTILPNGSGGNGGGSIGG